MDLDRPVNEVDTCKNFDEEDNMIFGTYKRRETNYLRAWNEKEEIEEFDGEGTQENLVWMCRTSLPGLNVCNGSKVCDRIYRTTVHMTKEELSWLDIGGNLRDVYDLFELGCVQIYLIQSNKYDFWLVARVSKFLIPICNTIDMVS